jgi:DNA-binding transcriptional LysR family regulator
VKLDDMRLFAKVAEAQSFSAAARSLGVPKQTLSRRVGELEAALDVQLLRRTTRRLHLTDVGAAYAVRCADVVRLADEANRAVTATDVEPNGLLRITADPLFGETFLPALVAAYANRWESVQIEVMLTRRRVDLVDEGFDVAFRIGQVEDRRLSATSLGPARIRYCASPSYVRRRGAPKTGDDLSAHDCLVVNAEGEPPRWPVRGKKGIVTVPVGGRFRFNTFAMTYAAALSGLGIALCPDFACQDDLRRRRLVSVLHPNGLDVGAVSIAHPTQRYLSARVRSFVELATEHLRDAPWLGVSRPRA